MRSFRDKGFASKQSQVSILMNAALSRLLDHDREHALGSLHLKL
jgi:hypothetical protein